MTQSDSAVSARAEFTVIVKRTTGAAIVRDLDRHLPGVEYLVTDGKPFPECGQARIDFTVAGWDATATANALRRWFAEGNDQPYPAGSLLWFWLPESAR